MYDLWSAGGPFIGDAGAPNAYVTVEKNWYLYEHITANTPDPSKLPFRYWQRQNNQGVQTIVPNVKSIDIDRSLDADAATATIVIYNQEMLRNTVGGLAGQLGQPGFYSFGYGDRDAAARWGQVANSWKNVLIPNALIRVYQGYGGRSKALTQALEDGNVLLTGVFLVDEVRISTDGMMTLQCRDMAKLLIEQQIFPPLIPSTVKYPLNYYRFKSTPVTSTGNTSYDYTNPTAFGPGAEGPKYINDIAITGSGDGYWLVGTDGAVFTFGSAPFYGSRGSNTDNGPMVAIEPDPLRRGYWLASNQGGVFSFGDAPFLGSATLSPGATVRAMSAHPNGLGYWLVTQTGSVHAFGSSAYHGGNPGGASDIIDIVTTVSGNGYYLLDDQGHIYTYGDAQFFGSGTPPGSEVATGLAVMPQGNGYYICYSGGDVDAFGSAPVVASNGIFDETHLNDPIVAIEVTPSGHGYLLVGGDGGVYSFGDAPFYGSLPADYSYENITDGNYKDWADIIKDLLLWAGWLFFNPDNLYEPVQVYGNIETTGSYSTVDLPLDMFDKKSIIDGINAVKLAVGYIFYIDEEGAARFETPNWYSRGNRLDDGRRVEFLYEIDEKLQLTDYTVQYNDQNIRSEIIVTNYYEANNTAKSTVTTRQELNLIEPFFPIIRGMIRPAMLVNGYLSSAHDQQKMVDSLINHITFSLRQGSVQCVANPVIQINDQIRVYERQSGETFVHFVRGYRSSMDLDAGTWTQTFSTNWLGEDFAPPYASPSPNPNPIPIPPPVPAPPPPYNPAAVALKHGAHVDDANASAAMSYFQTLTGIVPLCTTHYVAGNTGPIAWGTNEDSFMTWLAGDSRRYLQLSVGLVQDSLAHQWDDTSHDAAFSAFFATLNSHGMNDRIGVRMGWEMNGNWFPWGWQTTDGDNAAGFVRCFDRKAPLIRAAAPGVLIDWCPNGFVLSEVTQYKPNEANYDIVSQDHYYRHDLIPDPAVAWSTDSLPMLTAQTAFAAAHNKLLGIGEYGVSFDAPSWMSNMIQWIIDHNYKYAAYFNDTDFGLSINFALNNYPLSKAVYTAMLGPFIT